MNTRRRYLPYLLLFLLSLALFVPGQASLPPLDRDESRYTQATAQMFETGNFVDIRFQDQPRYLQPAGIYWLQAASVSLLSAPEDRDVWAYRVPSLIGATFAVLLTAWIGNLLFGAPVGFVAAVLIAVSVILGVEARMAKIDAVLLATVLAAQASLAKIYLESTADREASLGWAVAFWLALGAGVMLKGPIILLVVFGTILLLTITERRVAWLWRLRPTWGVPLLLLVVLPWFIAIAVKEPAGQHRILVQDLARQGLCDIPDRDRSGVLADDQIALPMADLAARFKSCSGSPPLLFRSGYPLEDPQYLRGGSHRLQEIIRVLSDPEVKKELAAHSLYLAQRAEAINRVAEDPEIIQMNIERYRSMLRSETGDAERRRLQTC